ncbi:uncharacterized protein IUM83_04201 [Phytophthora cinnamomi]|uniref:uncharacterized protein n=1 Tax=Phytophthora cinnamomi TaxID=4785 RepID=UPI00355AAD24|nr:hypothetical protein IUM83_04201 [Phytophthora cinnamomi]
MLALEDVVQGYVKKRLVDQKLGFAVDAWTEDGTHFVAYIAMTSADKYLVSFSKLSDESDLSSDTIIELFGYELDTYGINAAYNCASTMNLAMRSLMEDNKDLLEKVQRLMTRLNTINNRHHLREADALIPMFSNATHWSSTFAIIDRYFAVYRKVDCIDDDLADYIPTSLENVQLETLYDDLKNLESVNKKLQSASVSLLDVCKLFDHVVKIYHATQKYLAPIATLVKYPGFSNGIVKVLDGKQGTLTRAERTAVAKLLRSDGAREQHIQPSVVAVKKKRSFADVALE